VTFVYAAITAASAREWWFVGRKVLLTERSDIDDRRTDTVVDR